MIDGSCKIHETTWVAASADVLGNVTIGRDCGIWFHSTIRAEGSTITIGEESNVQDNCVVHVDPGYSVQIGSRVTIGHGAIVHGCSIGDETLIGMGATILNGAQIGSHCIIGAGALVTENMVVPDGSMAVGVPARVIRKLEADQIQKILKNARAYVDEKNHYKERKDIPQI